jgi:DNA-binding MarR family transcriptional regulator
MAEVVQAMVDKGWITRSTDPENARVLRTALTRDGTKMLRAGAAEIANVERRLTGVLKHGEESALRDMLERCASAFGVAPAQLKRLRRGHRDE